MPRQIMAICEAPGCDTTAPNPDDDLIAGWVEVEVGKGGLGFYIAHRKIELYCSSICAIAGLRERANAERKAREEAELNDHDCERQCKYMEPGHHDVSRCPACFPEEEAV